MTNTTAKKSFVERAVQLAINAIRNEAADLLDDAEACNTSEDAKRDLLAAEAQGMENAAVTVQVKLDAGRFRPSSIDMPS